MEDHNVINISGITISEGEIAVLNKGLNFAPMNNFNLFNTVIDLQKYVRKLSLKKCFASKDKSLPEPPPLVDRDLTDPSQTVDDLQVERFSFKEYGVLQDMLDLERDDNISDSMSTEEQFLFLSGMKHTQFRSKSIFCPSFSKGPHLQTYERLVEKDLQDLAKGYIFTAPSFDNLSKEDRINLNALKKRSDIVIKNADKGGAVVIMHTEAYHTEAMRQLSNTQAYCKLDKDPTRSYLAEIRELFDLGRELGVLNSRESTYLYNPFPTVPIFHHLPKIHKTLVCPPGRPIISSIGSLGDGLSRYVDYFLQTLVKTLPAYLRDSADLLQDIQRIQWLNGYTWVTLDVTSLYTIIDHTLGTRAISHFLNHSNLNLAQNTFLLDSVMFLLQHNYFMFDSQFYLQSQGTAMGTSFAPSYANLYMGFWESIYIFGDTNPFRDNIIFYRRFIDDLLFIWNGDDDTLHAFFEYLEANTYNLRFTHCYSDSQIDFLDLHLYIDVGQKIQTNIFRKTNSKNSLLRSNSAHPRPLIKGIPKGQFLRLRRLCSTRESFLAQAEDLKRRFRDRGYVERDLESAFNYALETDREYLLKKRNPKKTLSNNINNQCPLFITTFSKQAEQIRHILQKHWGILKLDTDLDPYTTQKPRMVFKKAKTIGNYVSPSLFELKAKNTKPLPKGFFKCGLCNLCRYAEPLKSVRDIHSGQIYRLESFMTCNTNFVIYLLKCACGSGYIGRTIRALKVRITEHIRSIKNSDERFPVARHFNTCPSGSIKTLTYSAIETIPIHPRGGHREASLNRREMFWIYALGTLAPRGMNQDWELKHFLT
ncbi:uncharacterized protein LOC142491850 [Ascaphus truei]|uniref:uncharacterized protein LOC142491850 n=1 Tax=Ascaphus truei TaxID=8439 RepID=UPI003F5A3003